MTIRTAAQALLDAMLKDTVSPNKATRIAWFNLKSALAEPEPAPEPPPECQTEAEKRAFAFGWFKAQEAERLNKPPKPEPDVTETDFGKTAPDEDAMTPAMEEAHRKHQEWAKPAPEPQPSEQECNETDELLRNLGLDPEHYRTDGGFVNHRKVKAAIKFPENYPQLECEHEFVDAPASLGGRICKKCSRMEKPEAQPPKPAPEPVAWMHEWEDGERIPLLYGRDDRNDDQPKSVRPLVYGDTPQPAEWRELTLEEITAIWHNSTPTNFEAVSFAHAISAALREKSQGGVK